MSAIDDLTDQITGHLLRTARRDEPPQTIQEIAADLGVSASRIRTALNRLKSFGEARELGEAASGARTWVLASDPRFPN